MSGRNRERAADEKENEKQLQSGNGSNFIPFAEYDYFFGFYYHSRLPRLTHGGV